MVVHLHDPWFRPAIEVICGSIKDKDCLTAIKSEEFWKRAEKIAPLLRDPHS